MKETEQQMLAAMQGLTQQLQRLNDYLQFGGDSPQRGAMDPEELHEALRAIASGEESCVFMAEGTKIYEA
jgi:hypothetical protein